MRRHLPDSCVVPLRTSKPRTHAKEGARHLIVPSIIDGLITRRDKPTLARYHRAGQGL